MKLLFDQNLSFKLCESLADIFSESSHVRILGLAEADDLAIWNFAKANGYTIVSQDSDFADMAVLMRSPPKVIWVRTGNQPSDAIITLLRFHAELIVSFESDEAVCLEIY